MPFSLCEVLDRILPPAFDFGSREPSDRSDGDTVRSGSDGCRSCGDDNGGDDIHVRRYAMPLEPEAVGT